MIKSKELSAALSAADEEFLTGISNKGIYKRALKDSGNTEYNYSQEENSVCVRSAEAECIIKLPLNESTCSCPSRTVCRHIIGAILFLKKSTGEIPGEEIIIEKTNAPEEIISEETEEPEKMLSGNEIEIINDTARLCEDLIGNILVHGLTRSADSLPADLEIAAVRCHAAKMADAERLMREISGRLSDCLGRRASFDIGIFTRRICECHSLLKKLSEKNITASELGKFRSEYIGYNGILDIFPIGQRIISGGDYEGNIYYFLDMNERADRRFLSFSDIRPAFYEKKKSKYPRPQAEAWDLGIPIGKLMHTRITLAGAKLSGGKISSSKETSVTSKRQAVPDCPEVWRLIVTDLREIAFKISQGAENELDSIFFIRPKRLEKYYFDKFEQKLRIILSDEFGNKVSAEIKYRTETKQFTEQTEKICERMEECPRLYTMLASARIENGRLILFPIGFYDNIFPVPGMLHTFEMPANFSAEPEKAAYSNEINRLFDETENAVLSIMRSGLRSGAGNYSAITGQIKNCGMENFLRITDDFFRSAEAFRHSTSGNTSEILEKMTAVYEYISAGRKKTALISSITNLKGE